MYYELRGQCYVSYYLMMYVYTFFFKYIYIYICVVVLLTFVTAVGGVGGAVSKSQ